MFNLSETAKISCHYEPFTTAGAIFRETDRTNLYSQYVFKTFLDTYLLDVRIFISEWKMNILIL